MRNRIPRSYLEISKNDFEIYFKDEILDADALIIEVEDLNAIFLEFDKFQNRFDFLRSKFIQIYVKLNTYKLQKSFKSLKIIDPIYIDGFALPRASSKLLNQMVVRTRDFENYNKLNFGSLGFIAYIDSPESVLNYRKIASYGRVNALYIDEESYLNNLGLKKGARNYLREQVFVYSALSKKPLIDSNVSCEYLEEDLITGKGLGASSKLTKTTNQLKIINQFYTPTESEIEEARLIYSTLLTAKKKELKRLKFSNLEISEPKIIQSQIILSRSNLLQKELSFVIENESIKDGTKILRPKKFYTFGEEVANAITHGIGAIMAIIFLIMLLIKGKDAGFVPNLAYLVYGFSAFTLYISSTLYHGLPLGSRAKSLFQKFDHMSIYLLIAGTYTPLTLITLGGKLGLTLFTILWVGSFIGIILNFLHFGKFKMLHMFLYVFLGWIAIFYINSIFQALGTIPSILILLGGLAYTVGIIFYSLKLFKFTHMVWHLFTILGTILHFIAIYLS